MMKGMLEGIYFSGRLVVYIQLLVIFTYEFAIKKQPNTATIVRYQPWLIYCYVYLFSS